MIMSWSYSGGSVLTSKCQFHSKNSTLASNSNFNKIPKTENSNYNSTHKKH